MILISHSIASPRPFYTLQTAQFCLFHGLVTHLFYIYSPIGCFRTLAILSNMAASMGIQVCHFYCLYTQKWDCWIIYDNFMFLRILHNVFHSGFSSLHSHPVVHRGSPFSAFLAVFVISCLFDNSWLLLLVQMLFFLLFVDRSQFW